MLINAQSFFKNPFFSNLVWKTNGSNVFGLNQFMVFNFVSCFIDTYSNRKPSAYFATDICESWLDGLYSNGNIVIENLTEYKH